jgi:hypothetical protein
MNLVKMMNLFQHYAIERAHKCSWSSSGQHQGGDSSQITTDNEEPSLYIKWCYMVWILYWHYAEGLVQCPQVIEWVLSQLLEKALNGGIVDKKDTKSPIEREPMNREFSIAYLVSSIQKQVANLSKAVNHVLLPAIREKLCSPWVKLSYQEM